MGARRSSFMTEQPAAKPESLSPSRQWSAQQQAIFDWFTSGTIQGMSPDDKGNTNLVVRARAGTGKTTTIIEGVNRAPESSILVCAFNKRIAEELNTRIDNSSADAKTFHALGYAAIRRQWPGISVAQGSARADALTDLVCILTPEERKAGKWLAPKQIRRLISQLHTKARDMSYSVIDKKALTNMALFFDLLPDEGWESSGFDLDYVVEKAEQAMIQAATVDPPSDIGIDFADMIFLPLVWGLLSKDYDMVVVDEAQDLSMSQLEMAQRVCSGRICVVGDDRQSCYGFRGADSGSIDRLKAELRAGVLPLTTTYRCSQKVSKRAQRLVPDLVAAASNPEGIVDESQYETVLATVQPGDFILSRLNAPLVILTLQLLKFKKRARMAGRDIGVGIQAILKKLGCQTWTSIEDMLTKLDTWERKTTTRFASYGQVELVERTRDQAGMLRALAEEAEHLDDLLNRIEWLFTDDKDAAQILCSSIHKAKGLEANRVYILQESLYRRGVTQEEQNLDYVATTRAKQHLTLVTGVPSLQRGLR